MKVETINWENYIFNEQGQPINPIAKIVDVEKIENELNIKFPKDFLDVSMKHQGQVVDDLSIKVRSMEVGFSFFYLFSDRNNKKDVSYTISAAHENMHQDDEEGNNKLLIPIANSFGSSKFCLDYRESLDDPSVVFYYSDRAVNDDAITVLANSFTEFLDMLYEDED